MHLLKLTSFKNSNSLNNMHLHYHQQTLAQLYAPNTARQFSQAIMPLNGLQLDDQLVRRSSMLGQLNLVCLPHYQKSNALANGQLIPFQPQEHINAPTIRPSVSNTIAAIPVISTRLLFCSHTTINSSSPNKCQKPHGKQCHSVTALSARTEQFSSCKGLCISCKLSTTRSTVTCS